MSDSDEEFGGLEPTTPYIARKRNPIVNPSDSEAGPSRNTARPAGKRKGATQSSETKKRQKDASEEEDEEADRRTRKGKQASKPSGRANNKQDVIIEELEDDVEEIEAPQQTKPSKSKKPPSKSTVTAAKAKAKPRVKTSTKAHETEEPMDVDDVEVLRVDDDDDDDNNLAQKELANAINASGKSGPGKLAPNGITKAKAAQNNDRIARLQREVDKLKERNADLQRQLEEVHKVRSTEPELLLQRLESQFQEERQVRDALIKSLQDQLARQDPLLRSGKKSAFEVLTRDEANNEVKALHKQLEAYRTTIKDQQVALQEKEKLITELQDEKQHLRVELSAEIERSKTLASKAQHQPPPSVNRQRVAPTNEDPKFGTVIRFYEDLTNLIIPSMKMFPGKVMGMDEWHLSCFYTYKDVTSQTQQPPKSLSFTLRLCHEPVKDDDTDSKANGGLVESVQYIPQFLDKEDEEFVKSLGFLSTAFTFERDQLSLFIKTLYDNLSGDNDKDDQDDDDSS